VSTGAVAERRGVILLEELAKLPAFLRRDLLTAWSYRVSFVSDILNLVLQTVTFYFVGLMVDDDVLPSYGGQPTSYLEFAVVGIALSMFIALGLSRVARAVRTEQLMGTLESVLMTPTAPATIQFGSVIYDLIYIPIRTGMFLVIAAALFGLDFDLAGVGAATAVLLAFIPFVWGLGIITAAGALTIRGSTAGIGFSMSVLTLVSGAYFPLDLFPTWIQTLAEVNPLAIAIEGMREALLGASGWSDVAGDIARLVPMSVASLVGGVVAFRLALRRERRIGTLGHY
jgi:ABC-2 type transport system permease protein